MKLFERSFNPNGFREVDFRYPGYLSPAERRYAKRATCRVRRREAKVLSHRYRNTED